MDGESVEGEIAEDVHSRLSRLNAKLDYERQALVGLKMSSRAQVDRTTNLKSQLKQLRGRTAELADMTRRLLADLQKFDEPDKHA